MSTPLVIGYGNTLRGDDGAGVVAAELIRGRNMGVDVITVHELQPELAEAIASRSDVVFVDASITTPRLTIRALQPGNTTAQGSHLLSPEQLLTLAKSLYGGCPAAAFLMEIPAVQFEFGEFLSEEVARSVAKCPEALEAILRKGRAGTST